MANLIDDDKDNGEDDNNESTKEDYPLVLIVDDEPMNVYVVQSLLSKEGV